ncbi:hypothetical protein FACS1894140_5320 [Spirochaetia bacterium]|nr:hypothetical protein FACS1894140_5320 [Spirochaetia bacterium]
MVLGSQGLSGAADSTIVLRRGRGERQAELLATGRDIPEQELILSFDLNAGGWTIQGDKKDIQETAARQEILEWLKINGPHKPHDVYKGMKAEGASREASTVRVLLTKMVSDSVLQNENGVYSVYGVYGSIGSKTAPKVADTPINTVNSVNSTLASEVSALTVSGVRGLGGKGVVS